MGLYLTTCRRKFFAPSLRPTSTGSPTPTWTVSGSIPSNTWTTAQPRFFASEIHEFAQTIDAALGLADVQRFMVDAVKGSGNPANYFELFRNSSEVVKPSHTWFRNHVVTGFDDHDQ